MTPADTNLPNSHITHSDTSRPAGEGGSIRTAADLVEYIEGQIVGGHLKPGDRLAPVRVTAGQLGLAPNTASAAYRRLQERGLIFGNGRRGTFVAERLVELPGGDQAVPPGLTDLANGAPDPKLLPDLGAALRTVAKASAAGRGAENITYGHQAFDDALAATLVADIEPDLTHVLDHPLKPGETVAVVGGALDGIERALAANLRPGDMVAVEDPGYTSVLNLVAAMNLRSVPFAVDQRGPNPADLARAVAEGAKAAIITPRAQNPTGAAMDRGRADEIAEILVDRQGLLIIEDDYAGPVAGAKYHSAVPVGAENWVVIRSVAKSLGPDLRLAALAGDANTVRRVTTRQLLGTGWVSHILQQTVAALLADQNVVAGLEQAAAIYGERRQYLIDRLAMGGVAAHGRSGLNVWIPVPDEAEVVSGMQARGYAVRSGSRFRRGTPPAIRITTAAADPQTLDEAAGALIEALGTGPAVRTV